MGRPIDDDYSRNQCALMIRVDGNELYMPLNFGLRADEIMEIYPYLLDMFNNPAKNPSLQFQEDVKKGKYKDMPEKEYRDLLLNMKRLSMLWYNKAEESLLSIALRFAVDIKLRGIEELRHLFETVRPLEKIDVEKQLTDEEAERILEETGMSHPTEKEFDPGDEQDVPLGVAGGIGVNLYESGAPEDYLNDELDAMESRLKVQDAFQEVADGTKPVGDEYASKYEQGQKLTAAQAKGGILGMYQEDEGSVFDSLDKEDGLSEVKYDDDYRDFSSHTEDGGIDEGAGPVVTEEEPESEEDPYGGDVMPEDEDEDGELGFLGYQEEDGPDDEEDPVEYYEPDDSAPDSGDEE